MPWDFLLYTRLNSLILDTQNVGSAVVVVHENKQFMYILVGGLKVTYSYQVLKNNLEDVTNDVRDCPGGGPCYVLVYVGLEAGLVTQSEDSLFCPQQKWTFHLFLHFDSADF